MNLKPLILLPLVFVLFTFVSAKAETPTSNYEEAREVARQAYIFAFPMLENYRTMVLQAVIP
ncbi:MAG TPA: DUF1254 domain-containing protein, partial [Mesotoga sp.]|nr:DUF1254 domain-containing protein [Mesotoga sp.]